MNENKIVILVSKLRHFCSEINKTSSQKRFIKIESSGDGGSSNGASPPKTMPMMKASPTYSKRYQLVKELIIL